MPSWPVSPHALTPSLCATGELHISFWDVCQNTGLPIVGEMYDQFFLANKLILDKKLPTSLQQLFRTWWSLFKGSNRPKFIKWVKEFIPELLDNNPRKSLPLSAKIWRNEDIVPTSM